MQRASLLDQLEEGLAILGQELAADTRARLIDYLELLTRWNAAYNLTAVRATGDMVARHLLDSLAIAPWVHGTSLADLGSGAGLPGLILAIAMPRHAVTLIDANGKKTRFLREAVRSLELDNVEVVQARIENFRGSFDCITARALASLAEMLALGGHLLAADGRWLALKGRHPEDELSALPPAFRLESEHMLQIPGLDAERHLLVLTRSEAA